MPTASPYAPWEAPRGALGVPIPPQTLTARIYAGLIGGICGRFVGERRAIMSRKMAARNGGRSGSQAGLFLSGEKSGGSFFR